MNMNMNKNSINDFTDEELFNIINSNPEIKKQYQELLAKHQNEALQKQYQQSKPVNSQEYMKIEKNLEKYLDKEGGIVIEPEPRLVFKTFEKKTKEKIFINVLTHPIIDSPEEKFLVDYENQPGIRVPMSLGRLKEDSDKKGEFCKVIDAIINPAICDNIQKDASLRMFFIQLLQGYCEQKYKIALDEKFTQPKLRYKGKSIEFQRVKGKKAPKIQQLSEEEVQIQQQMDKQGKKLIEDMKQQNNPQNIKAQRPQWTLKMFYQNNMPQGEEYDGDFDLQNLLYLQFEIEMPLLVTARHTFLEINESNLYLKNGKIYELALRFPLRVDKQSCQAEFDMQSRCLLIKIQPLKAIEIADEEEENINQEVHINIDQKMFLNNNMLDDLV